MFKISKQSDYGLLVLSYLKNKADFVPVSEILKNLRLPKRFLAKIASALVKNKILESKEGISGGYRLTANVKRLSLYDYLKIFEGDLEVVNCSCHSYKCLNDEKCQQKKFFKRSFTNEVIKILKNKRLLTIV